jgi:hypothetical protein
LFIGWQMLELKIDQLNLNIQSAAGHEHRIQPIAARAAVIFAARLNERWPDGGGYPDSGSIDSLSAPPLNLNLNDVSDEQAAHEIATAWLEALPWKPQ